MPIASTLFGMTIALYGAACVLYLWNLVGESKTARTAAWVSSAGLSAHTGGIIALGLSIGRAPFANLYESLLFLVWALVGLYALMARKYRIGVLGVFVMLGALCAIAVALALPKGTSTELLPALRSRWSAIHVVSSLISYASFVLAFAAAAGYMSQEKMLKAKRINSLQRHLPALSVMDSLAYKLVSLGFPMLTLGIVTGSLWAQSAWGRYWGWDPKETWALITWLVYAAYLHVRIVQGRRGKWANRILVAGFLCVVVTFLGVNFLGRGLHQYGW